MSILVQELSETENPMPIQLFVTKLWKIIDITKDMKDNYWMYQEIDTLNI